jgi:hypothetical protein
MCLDRLEKFPVRKNKDGWVVAWKVFKSQTRTGYLPFLYATGRALAGRTYIAKIQHKMRNDDNPGYELGFHAYTTKRHALLRSPVWRGTCVYRVLLKDITATGYQDGLRVIVARKMIVPKEGK